MMLFSYLLMSGITTGRCMPSSPWASGQQGDGRYQLRPVRFFMFAGFIAWMLHVQFGINYFVTFVLAVGFGSPGCLNGSPCLPAAGEVRPPASLVLATVGIAFVLQGLARTHPWRQGGLFCLPADHLARPDHARQRDGHSAATCRAGGHRRDPHCLYGLLPSDADRQDDAGDRRQCPGRNLGGHSHRPLYTLAFGTGAAIAAAAAVLTAPLTLLYPDIGFAFFLRASPPQRRAASESAGSGGRWPDRRHRRVHGGATSIPA